MGPSNDRVMIERSKEGVVSNSGAASLINVVDERRGGIESMGASSLLLRDDPPDEPTSPKFLSRRLKKSAAGKTG
jgi:hypothetical protein